MTRAYTLLTANEADCQLFLERAKILSDQLLHLPLEKYEYFVEEEVAESLRKRLDTFVFIIYGNIRNAGYFLDWAKEEELLDDCKKRIHLVSDPATSALLEEHSLPAIMPREFAKGIDIIEFMLRIFAEGAVLYPTSDSHTEEIPGLLKELEMPVMEFTVCRERTLIEDELKNHREKLASSGVETVVFHNRSSVQRIKLAFPDLNLNQTKNIAADNGIAEQMDKQKIPVHEVANGTWRSLADVVMDKK